MGLVELVNSPKNAHPRISDRVSWVKTGQGRIVGARISGDTVV